MKLVADLAARIELARRYTDQKGLFRHRGKGETYPVVEQLDRWERRLSEQIRELDAEGRARGRIDPQQAIEAEVAEIVKARANRSA